MPKYLVVKFFVFAGHTCKHLNNSKTGKKQPDAGMLGCSVQNLKSSSQRTRQAVRRFLSVIQMFYKKTYPRLPIQIMSTLQNKLN